jgi:hypothetical protein
MMMMMVMMMLVLVMLAMMGRADTMTGRINKNKAKKLAMGFPTFFLQPPTPPLFLRVAKSQWLIWIVMNRSQDGTVIG